MRSSEGELGLSETERTQALGSVRLSEAEYPGDFRCGVEFGE